MKLWGGRFKKETDSLVNSFNSSIKIDCLMYKEDIEGSIAHAMMLGDRGIISKKESQRIVDGLNMLLFKIENEDASISFTEDSEDIHSFVENNLVDIIGESGKKLHTARSRNDQVALDLKLYLKRRVGKIIYELVQLEKSLLNIAQDNKDTYMPGYTHMQRAQSVTLAHHILAYGEMFKRDIGRLYDALYRMDEMPLGSGALASTTYPIDREYVADKLGFDRITLNSIDSVSDRDFVIEIVSALSIIMMHLSRFSEEIIIWSTSEFDFLEIDDGYSTGSSIMPQKKNPDAAELVRGKTGRVYGSLITLLTVMKALPLSYNKDMQEDKEALFDALDTAEMSIKVFRGLLDTLNFKKNNMRDALNEGFLNATDVADYLVKKGEAFRDAHKIVGEMVLYCIENKKNIEELLMEEFTKFSPIFEDDIYNFLSIEACIEGRNVMGGPGGKSVDKQIENLKEFIYEKEKGMGKI